MKCTMAGDRLYYARQKFKQATVAEIERPLKADIELS